jgi:hypothetical protein
MGIAANDSVSPQIQRYFAALNEMAGRKFVRDDYTRYEAVGLALVENSGPLAGTVNPAFPPPGSPLRIELFFSRLFEIYDLRYPFLAEHMPAVRRAEWHTNSPLFQVVTARGACLLNEALGYLPRLSG